jgi:hypothetical protein
MCSTTNDLGSGIGRTELNLDKSLVRQHVSKWLLVIPLIISFYAAAEGPRLNFQLLANVEETPIIQWKLLSFAPMASGAGGSGAVQVTCYSGPAYQLSAEGLGTNTMLIEASTNLTDWQSFPAPGFQLTFYSTSTPFLNIPEDKALFFRGVLATNQPWYSK